MTNAELLKMLNDETFNNFVTFGAEGFLFGFGLGLVVIRLLLKYIRELRTEISELRLRRRSVGNLVFGIVHPKTKAVL